MKGLEEERLGSAKGIVEGVGPQDSPRRKASCKFRG